MIFTVTHPNGITSTVLRLPDASVTRTSKGTRTAIFLLDDEGPALVLLDEATTPPTRFVESYDAATINALGLGLWFPMTAGVLGGAWLDGHDLDAIRARLVPPVHNGLSGRQEAAHA